MIKVAPSILSADFANMGAEVKRAEQWGADYIHFDVMDGAFVPTITFGPAMCRALRPHTELPVDVHLMVQRPGALVRQFADAGADLLTFHVEAEAHIHRTLQEIHAAGMKAGVVLNPATPLCTGEYILGECDMILLMSVNPGAGGQTFIPAVLDKIRALRGMAARAGVSLEIEVDGGVNPQTAADCIAAGADVLVAGSAVFGSADPAEAVRLIRGR